MILKVFEYFVLREWMLGKKIEDVVEFCIGCFIFNFYVLLLIDKVNYI